LEIQRDIPLAPLTTLRIGGPAEYFLDARTEDEIDAAYDWAASKSMPVFVLGGGSNLLIADRGVRGLTLLIRLGGRRNADASEPLKPLTAINRSGKLCETVDVAAGENWDDFVALCVQHGLAGIECLSGIPGTIGGTPVQNVGAYGQDVSETIARVRAFDRRRAKFVDLDHQACGFAYRTSIFNTTERDQFIVTAVRYQLRAGGAPTTRYAEVQRRFKGLSQPPTLAQVRNAVFDIRKSKAMVLVEGEPESRSAGSFFKNPIVSEAQYSDVAQRVKEPPPRFPANPGQVKIPAAWLIEHAGFEKGYRPLLPDGSQSPAGISSRHALAIVNYNGARAEHVIALKREIQQHVFDRFGVRLLPEPVFVGFEPGEAE
jgi:UDP-N-acetylmuramate dehydrogenase